MLVACVSRFWSEAASQKRRKNFEMITLHIPFERPTVKRTILKFFLRSLVRSWKKVFFTPALLFFMDVVFPTTPSTQLLIAVAFVPPLGPIIVGYRAVNSCSLVLGRASFCVAKRGTLAACLPGRWQWQVPHQLRQHARILPRTRPRGGHLEGLLGLKKAHLHCST